MAKLTSEGQGRSLVEDGGVGLRSTWWSGTKLRQRCKGSWSDDVHQYIIQKPKQNFHNIESSKKLWLLFWVMATAAQDRDLWPWAGRGGWLVVKSAVGKWPNWGAELREPNILRVGGGVVLRSYWWGLGLSFWRKAESISFDCYIRCEFRWADILGDHFHFLQTLKSAIIYDPESLKMGEGGKQQ